MDANTNKQIHPDQLTISLPIHLDSQTNPEQEKFSQRIEPISYFNFRYPTLDFTKKKIIEYSVIAEIILFFILVIT